MAELGVPNGWAENARTVDTPLLGRFLILGSSAFRFDDGHGMLGSGRVDTQRETAGPPSPRSVFLVLILTACLCEFGKVHVCYLYFGML